MPTIYNINNLLTRLQRKEATRKMTAPKQSALKPLVEDSNLTNDTLRLELINELQDIDLSSQSEMDRAKQIFFKRCLVSEFGQAFVNSPSYHKIVKSITEDFSAHKNINNKLEAFIKQLQKQLKA